TPSVARAGRRPPSAISVAAAASAFVRPAHQHKGGFDMPPGFGLFAFTLLFEATSLLSGLGKRLVAVGFKELPGVVVDVDFLHSHGVISTSSARRNTPIAHQSGRR